MLFGLLGLSRLQSLTCALMLPFDVSGALPYVGASITTVYLAHSAQLATTGAITNIDPGVALTILDQALNVQVTYGAVMLSFLGWWPPRPCS
jgi:hypothetical protein